MKVKLIFVILLFIVATNKIEAQIDIRPKFGNGKDSTVKTSKPIKGQITQHWSSLGPYPEVAKPKKRKKIFSKKLKNEVKVIYHDNGFTHEDSVRINNDWEKYKTTFMFFYKTKTQPTTNYADSLFDIGFRISDKKYSKAFLKHSKMVIKNKSRK